MRAEKSPHAPHLAAMAEDREALDAAILRLEWTVAAVEAVYRRLDGLRKAVPTIRILLGDAPGFERIAAEWARDRGVEHFVFRAGSEAGPDAARDRDRAIVEARPAGVMVFSDGRDAGFLARHAEEHRIPVSTLPTADLVRTARQSIDREREAREAQDRTIRKGPSMRF